MKLSGQKILWFFGSLFVSGYVGYCAFMQPEKFAPLVDLLATIVSILIGVSLAISAVLSSRPTIGNSSYANEDERKRIEQTINKDDKTLIEGQNIIFWFYYSTLLLAVIFKWLTVSIAGYDTQLLNTQHVKVVSGLFALVSSMSLLWSATLPSLLRNISIQRKNFD